MKKAVDEGTATMARIPGIEIAGKTGTAQNPHGEPHAWFICFAPYDDPEVALSVFVEHGGYGASAAAPLARQLLKAALKEARAFRQRENSDGI